MSKQRTRPARPSNSARKRPVPPSGRPSGGSSKLVFGVLIGVIALAGVAAIVAPGGGSNNDAGTGHEVAPVKVEGEALPRFGSPDDDAAVGQPIPVLRGTSLEGDAMTIEPNGRPQAILFVAHWCPHCQAEVPRIVSLSKAGALDGVDVTAVATGTNPDFPNYPPSAWLQREGFTYPAMADSRDFAAADAYGLPSYPFYVFVDGSGKVVGRASGEIPDDALTEIFAALAAGKELPLASNGAGTSA